MLTLACTVNRPKHWNNKSRKAPLTLVRPAARQFLLPLAAEPAFAALWVAALGALGECTKPRSEELAEAVPEALKNMLLVMAAQGVLTPAWTVRFLPDMSR